MPPIHLAKPGSLLRRCATVVIAVALLTTGFGLVVAVDDADTGEMSVSILPAGDTQIPPDAESGGNPLVGPPNLAPGPQTQSVARPGSVSAYIASSDESGAGIPSTLTIVVVDDRGTAAGWMVVLSTAPGNSGWAPALIDNRSSTVSLVLPTKNAQTPRESGIASGQTLGPLQQPMPILLAAPGSGAGLFSQRLGITVPSLPNDAPVTMFVQIPFAP